MADDPDAGAAQTLLQRLSTLEARLQESEETLEAIRRGEIDALVVGGPAEKHRVYTLEGADRPYRVLVEQIQEGAVTLGEDGTVLYCNQRLAGMLGLPQERVIGQPLRPLVMRDQAAVFDRLCQGARHGVARAELTLCAADARRLPVYLSLSPLRSEDGAMLLCGVLTDLTEQKLHLRELAETNARLTTEIAERKRIEDALRQSQKMEAVGQLTGGLAHDFNNLLAGITGSLELLHRRLAEGRTEEAARYIAAAQGAAKRAAALTHRLLAFSRQQTLNPKATDVNRLVAGLEELVRRTAGPQIAVQFMAGQDLWTTLVDPNQLENALLNLCINARDAMASGGTLTIETGNTSLDHRTSRARELPAGDYIALTVGDSGTGMTTDVIARAFDPFFTTKPIGTGTGLGLSMVYGFVRQSGGQVHIASRLGEGTRICLYLPRHDGVADAPGAIATLAFEAHPERIGTVLVIDDEPTVRMLVTDVLEDLGYKAVEAADGPAGLKLLHSDMRIDLLVTDVGLPGGLNGRQVAEAARLVRPHLHVLFITGYAEHAVLSHGHLDAGMRVLTKPFSLDALATEIKSLIG